jgi:type IV secretory pathway TrbL component
VLLAIFLLLVVGIGGCTFWVVGKVKGVTEVGNTFADRLYISPQEATKSVCPGSALDVARLQTERDALITSGWTGDKSLFGLQTSSDSTGSTGTITGTFGTTAATIDLAKNGSDWCVNDFTSGTTLVTPTGSIPEFTIPDISIPDISIPDLSIPDLTVPADVTFG